MLDAAYVDEIDNTCKSKVRMDCTLATFLLGR